LHRVQREDEKEVPKDRQGEDLSLRSNIAIWRPSFECRWLCTLAAAARTLISMRILKPGRHEPVGVDRVPADGEQPAHGVGDPASRRGNAVLARKVAVLDTAWRRRDRQCSLPRRAGWRQQGRARGQGPRRPTAGPAPTGAGGRRPSRPPTRRAPCGVGHTHPVRGVVVAVVDKEHLDAAPARAN
jgi:hypothetical protein